MVLPPVPAGFAGGRAGGADYVLIGPSADRKWLSRRPRLLLLKYEPHTPIGTAWGGIGCFIAVYSDPISVVWIVGTSSVVMIP